MKEYDLINSYVVIDDDHYDIELHSDKWLNCPKCNSKPLIWEFDNGNYCACKCATRYGKECHISTTPLAEHYREYK